MEIRIHGGERATQPGGVDIIISLTTDDNRALQGEADLMADWFVSALRALAALRTGHDGSGDRWYWTINDLDTRLLPRLEGIRDAVIREWAAQGGSHGHLALAMDVPRSTAQTRREAVTGRQPSYWETWARGPRGVNLTQHLP